MVDMTSMFSGLNDLYSQYQSQNAASNTNNQVGSLLGQQQGLLNNQAGMYTNQINNVNKSHNDLYNLQSGLTLGNIGNLQNQVNNNQGLQNTALNAIGEQRQGLQGMMGNWQNQINNSGAQGQHWFNAGIDALGQQRDGLQGDIDKYQQNLSNYTDPNSALMQMTRQAIERKDAAAGRRSQWGDREVQLAGVMMDNYGKYAPGLQQQIGNARGQMTNDLNSARGMYDSLINTPNSQNNQLQQLMLQGSGQMTKDLEAGAGIVNTLGQANDRTNALLSNQIGGMGNLSQILQNQGNLINGAIGGLGTAANGMGQAAGNANTTGRQAQYSQTNQQNQLLNSGLGMLGKLFGGSGGDMSGGIGDLSGLMGQLGSGLGDWGSSLSGDWFGGGEAGNGSLGFDLGSLFGSDTVGLDDGIGYDYGGTSGGIMDYFR